jgi:Ca-activated chloride channel homolog
VNWRLAAIGALFASPVVTASQTFTARIDSVRVDVLVSDGRQPVLGLEAADFEVLDNGVAQKVDLVAFERLPLNVMLALDLSDSVAGDRLNHLQQAGRAVVDALKPEDEVGLVTFSDAVIVRSALTHEHAHARTALVDTAETGDTSLVDASYAAIALAGADTGRALVIVFSDGADTSSFLKPEAVIATARRSDAVVYAVSVGDSGTEKFLRDLSEATGGRQLSVESSKKLSETLLAILDEFRHRYLVSFTPTGVSKDGWHQLEVKLKSRRAVVRARSGYWAR